MPQRSKQQAARKPLKNKGLRAPKRKPSPPAKRPSPSAADLSLDRIANFQQNAVADFLGVNRGRLRRLATSLGYPPAPRQGWTRKEFAGLLGEIFNLAAGGAAAPSGADAPAGDLFKTEYDSERLRALRISNDARGGELVPRDQVAGEFALLLAELKKHLLVGSKAEMAAAGVPAPVAQKIAKHLKERLNAVADEAQGILDDYAGGDK